VIAKAVPRLVDDNFPDALINRNKQVPLPVRMRAASEALPYENPKLSAVAVSAMSGSEFARALERAIARSSGKVIEAKAVEPTQPE
jgi:hypothetical protein